MFFEAVGGCVLGVAHFVGVGEEGVFYVVEAFGGCFFGFCRAHWWHGEAEGRMYLLDGVVIGC